jgi:Fur family transcriptional regulator, ferric uptake regulator
MRIDIIFGMAAVRSWREHTEHALREAGFRAGGARAAVLDLMSGQDCCASAQEIHASLRASDRSVGIASVYRVLEVLAELRLVQRVDVGDGIARFEPASPGGDHHHHVVCEDCGKVEPFSDPSLERAIASASGRLGYNVDAHEVVLRGECGDCRQPNVAASKPT